MNALHIVAQPASRTRSTLFGAARWTSLRRQALRLQLVFCRVAAIAAASAAGGLGQGPRGHRSMKTALEGTGTVRSTTWSNHYVYNVELAPDKHPVPWSNDSETRALVGLYGATEGMKWPQRCAAGWLQGAVCPQVACLQRNGVSSWSGVLCANSSKTLHTNWTMETNETIATRCVVSSINLIQCVSSGSLTTTTDLNALHELRTLRVVGLNG